MFSSNKNSYEVTVECSSANNEETYTFTEEYDEYWGDIAEEMFYDDFDEYPTSKRLISRKAN